MVRAELAKRVICSAMSKAQGSVLLFDGFPRSIAQIEMLIELLKEMGLDLCGVFVLTVDLPTIISRLSGRVCSDCGAIYNICTNPPKQAGMC